MVIKRTMRALLAMITTIAILPLAGCDRDVSAVHAEKDAKGNTSVHVDGEQVDKNFEQAGKQFDEAGREIKQGAEQAGDALQRGADKVGAEVGPAARQAGEAIKEGAEQAGDAIQRGAARVEAEVGPQVQAVMDDASITAKVKAKLIADPEVTALNIDVDTLDGRVTLSGKVASADQKAEAEKLASHTEGVKEIVNMIQVAGQAPPPPPAPRR
jgi:hyperosmotically inducible protein